MSFASTLYLCPILDLLLSRVPPKYHAEVRLGLQEALVNASKHGNKLDPAKTVVVKFSHTRGRFSWLICDQGQGFIDHCDCESGDAHLPCEDSENGRGLCILHQIFDQVNWDQQKSQLRLCKQIKKQRGKEPVLQ
jgi:anti-sigma regulatory factor (Ser/Thr protein kinase)